MTLNQSLVNLRMRVKIALSEKSNSQLSFIEI